MSSPSAIVHLPLQGAGVCTAAGGLRVTQAQCTANATPPGPELLDAYDLMGDPVTASAALPNRADLCREADIEVPTLRFMSRALPMLSAALQDLTSQEGMAVSELATARLFVVAPESAPDLGLMWIMQAWMSLHGTQEELAQRALLQRMSGHASVLEALREARAYLTVGQGLSTRRHALVLCCESWLTHEGLARLDSVNQLRSPSSDGVVPGEAAVLLHLGGGAHASLRCAGFFEPEDRFQNSRPLGTHISEAILALQHAQAGAVMTSVLCDAHAHQRAMSRETEFLRHRHWQHLLPDDGAWIDESGLGYLGHCAPLLQMAMMAQLPVPRLPAVAIARSLWRQSIVCFRAPTTGDSLAAMGRHLAAG